MRLSAVRRFALPLCLVAVASSLPLHAAEKAVDKGRAAAAAAVSFNVYVPYQQRDAMDAEIAALHDSSSPLYHHWLTPEQFEAKYAPSAAQMAAVAKGFADRGLTVTTAGSHRLHVTGTASTVETALSTTLNKGEFANGKQTVMATRAVTLPAAAASAGAVVTGLSRMIRMRSFAHAVTPQNRYSTAGPYWYNDLKEAYSFPSVKAYDGKGTTIGVLMTGDYSPADMAKYFGHEKAPVPAYSEVKINGGAPYDAEGSTETSLDMQQTGGMAPKASVILYNLPDLSDDNIIAGLQQIVKDNKADVVNMSFGGPELFYTAADNDGEDFTYLLRAEDDLFAQGNAQGITFVASSGDSGALAAVPVECFNYGPNCGAAVASVNFPASSPHVVGVGGTNLVTTLTTGSLDSTYVREQAYADPLEGDIFYGTSATGVYWGSGGGDSILFRKPLFQALTDTGNAKFRTVPDVSLHMGGCPGGAISCSPDDSADVVAVGGAFAYVIGTSASAPDFAGLTALAVQRFGTRLGNENFYLYALALPQNLGLPGRVFKQGIPGFNGKYYGTSRGYNRVLGNGTVSGKDFLLAPFAPVAGTPQTASNP